MKNTEKKPKYAMRKLSVGLVSCMLGFALVSGPSHSLADEEVEGEKTEASQPLEEDKSEENSLEISEEKIEEPVGQEEKNIYKYNFAWKSYEENKKGLYDETHNGEPIKLKLRLTYVDPKNKRNSEYVYSEDIDFVIGQNKSIDLDIDEYAKKSGIKNPRFIEAALVADEKTNNYKFITGTKTKVGSKEFDYVISQNMDTSIKEEKEKDAIILEKDEDKIDVNYKIVEYEKDGENPDGTYKFSENPKDKTIRRRKERGSKEMVDIPLAHERKFKDGEEFKLAWEDYMIGGSINRNRELHLFSLLGKDRKYGIAGEFKDEKHKKYYTLKIEGSDLEGWKVTLGSKLKEKEIHDDTVTEFETEYIYDPTLDDGVEIEKQPGQNGIVRDTFKLIYLPGEGDNPDETVKKIDISKNEKIQDLIKRIVRIGTKKPSPSIPEVKPEEDSPIIPLDPNSFRNKEDEEEYNRLVKELTEEIEKEVEKSKENTSQEKTDDKKEEKPSQEKSDDKKEEKPSVEKEKETDKKEENTDPKKSKKENKNTPAKGKINPKTGVAGSGSIISILAGAALASLGLRKKND